MLWLPPLALASTPTPVDLESGAGLEALAEVFGDAEVVGIGESIHFSGGLERARARVGLEAVQTLGFRAVAFELSWIEARSVDAGLLACAQGAEVVVVPFDDPLWDGFRPLLQALCSFNAEHPSDPVRAFGVDVQDAWNHRRLLEGGGPPDEALRSCHGAPFACSRELSRWGQDMGYPAPEARDQERCLARLEELAQTSSGTTAMAVASLVANETRARALFVDGDVAAAYEAREAAMAAVFHQERARVGEPRTVLFAHDTHVGRGPASYLPLGARLHPELAYAALSVDGYRVEARYEPNSDPPVPAAGSREHAWAELPGPAVLVELEDGPHDAVLYLDHASRD